MGMEPRLGVSWGASGMPWRCHMVVIRVPSVCHVVWGAFMGWKHAEMVTFCMKYLITNVKTSKKCLAYLLIRTNLAV